MGKGHEEAKANSSQRAHAANHQPSLKKEKKPLTAQASSSSFLSAPSNQIWRRLVWGGKKAPTDKQPKQQPAVAARALFQDREMVVGGG